jgi:arylsulfatase A-like enzyme
MRARSSILCLALACTADPMAEPEAPPVPSGARVPTGPDLFLLTVESWRADHLQSQGYGRDTMPRLESMLVDARVFSHAIAPSSWTLPSMASILTGLTPSEHGLRLPGLSLGEGARTTAELLSEAGYSTAFFGVNPWLVEGSGLDQGYDRWDARPGDSGDRLLRDLEVWLESRESEAPLFLHLHFFEPHCKYRPPRQQQGLFEPSEPEMARTEQLSPEQYESMGDCYRLQDSQGQPLLDLETYLARYDAELRATDGLIARSLELLGARSSDSLFILTGDHGESFWEHGDFGHGRQLYEESVHVPLVLLGSQSGAAGKIETPVSLTDIHTTLASAAGLSSQTGRDLRAPLIEAPIFSETDQDGVSLRAAWIADRKVIWDRQADIYQGFELGSDPAEMEPRFADLLLKRALNSRFKGEAGQGLSIERALDSEAQQALQALGYAD